MIIPSRCPMCGEDIQWIMIDDQKTGFSLGKAILGDLIFGSIGLLWGLAGKHKIVMRCGKCGFQQEYDKH